MNLGVQNDIENDHPAFFHEVVDAVVVCEHTPNVVSNGVEPGFARIGRHGIGCQAADAVDDFVFCPFRTNEGGALKLANDAFDGGGGPVGEDDVTLHERNVGTRGQRRG